MNNPQDAIVALQTKVGINSSGVTTSHDYKIAQLESGRALTGGSNATGTWPISITGSAASATTATTATSAGNATTVGGFTPSASSGVANRVVVADASGYIYNNYINTSDNSQGSSVSAVMVKAGDNFLRSGTAAAVATFLSGQTMNIVGSATTARNITAKAGTTKTLSTSAPSGGSDGDIWYKY